MKIHLQKFLHMKFNAFGIFTEIRFPKNSLKHGVSGVQSLDVVTPNLVLQDHVSSVWPLCVCDACM
jgi:hypothetical protein